VIMADGKSVAAYAPGGQRHGEILGRGHKGTVFLGQLGRRPFAGDLKWLLLVCAH
jgi:hypothetical protein